MLRLTEGSKPTGAYHIWKVGVVIKILLDLHNSSHPTQPPSIATNYDIAKLHV